MMSQYLHTKHHSILLPNKELFPAINQATVARDLIGMLDIDASLYLFAREIKKEVTVVLSGEGADELFGGYPWIYRPEMIHATTFPWARLLQIRLPFVRSELIQCIKPLEYVQQRYQEALAEVPILPGESRSEARLREIFFLCLTRSLPSMLDRKDQMGMACGLEIRVPFCDHKLVEYVWNIPWSMKNYGNREKGLLRYALQGVLPEEIRWRKKSPFPKTHHPAFLTVMQQLVQQLVTQKNAPVFQILDRQKVSEFVEKDLSNVNLPGLDNY